MAETSGTSMRKGTKSCTECRRRKTRCIFTSPNDLVCNFCATRGRKCLPQTARKEAYPAGRARQTLTAKDRIRRLERQIAALTSVVGDHSEGHLTRNHSIDDQGDESGSERSSDEECVSAAEDEAHVSRTVVDLLPAATPPTHIRSLFNNALIGCDGSRQNDGNTTSLPTLQSARCSPRLLSQMRMHLQRLIPPREDVDTIIAFAGPWMELYNGFYPKLLSVDSRENILNHREKFVGEDAHPVKVAGFLLTLAITARQLPSQQGDLGLKTLRDIPHFVRDVIKTVQRTVVSQNELAMTIEGIETTLMYIRLQLGCGDIRDHWLTLRRTIALAELLGIQRAPHRHNKAAVVAGRSELSAVPSATPQDHRQAILEAICATDRLAAMMFNLPSATSAYHFPPREITSPQTGQVDTHAFLFELAAIAVRVQDVDEQFAAGYSPEDIYDKVLGADRELRKLASKTPREWWNDSEPVKHVSAAQLMRFWHCYLTIRVHLHFALGAGGAGLPDEHGQYAYSCSIGVTACERLARRYVQFRQGLPTGFFLARLMHMQVFTGATMLLLANLQGWGKSGRADYPINSGSEDHLALVAQVVAGLELDARQVGGEFAGQAAAAVRSLSQMLNDPSTALKESVSLRIPMLGNVVIGRRQHAQSISLLPSPSDYPSGQGNDAATTPESGRRTASVLINTESQQRYNPTANIPASTTIYYGAPIAQNSAMPPAVAPLEGDPMSWLLELDLSTSAQDPFMTGPWADLDQWFMDGVDSTADTDFGYTPNGM